MPSYLVALLALTLALGTGATRADPPQPVAHGLSVAEAIARLEQDGHSFIYPTSVLHTTRDLRLHAEREPSIESLRQALQTRGFTLDADHDGTWFVMPWRQDDPVTRRIGRVTDAVTGEPLANVRVEIEGTTVFTNAAGEFELPTTPADALAPALLLTHEGYRLKKVAADAVEEFLVVPMDREPRIEEIVVVSSRYALRHQDAPSVHALDPTEQADIPQLGSDALRASVHLPGTASIGLSAKPHIRGGLQDETLVMFNDVELLEPFHLKDFQSAFAGFNPSLVDSIDVYTGGFPARFGDRMSGVMDIRPAEEITSFGAELMVSLLTASASAVGVTDDGRGQWAVTTRRGNLDLILKLVDSQAGDPRYSDSFASFSYEVSDATTIELGTILYSDDVLFKDVDDGDGELAQSQYRNAYGWVQLHRDWSRHASSSTSLSYGSIEHDREGFILDLDPEEGDSSLNETRRFDVWSLSHRHKIDPTDRLSIELGGRINIQRGRYDSLAEIRRGVVGELIGLPLAEDRSVHIRPKSTNGGIYLSTRLLPRPWFALETGLRWDYQDFGSNTDDQWSPRVSARLDLTDFTELRLSAGRFYQPEQIHELQSADGVTEFQDPQFADHYILGLHQLLGESGVSLRIEAFHKAIKNPKRRFENLFNNLVLLPEAASDRIEISPSRARSSGLEATLRYQRDDALHAWLSYTQANSEDRVAGRWEHRGWDQSQTLSAGVIWRPGAWTLSAAVLWHSGWRTTLLPEIVMADEVPLVRRNANHLRDFFTLDLKIDRTWQWPRQSLTVFAEINNALHRNNVGALEYDVEEDEVTGNIHTSSENFTLLPIVPSIGVRWSFD